MEVIVDGILRVVKSGPVASRLSNIFNPRNVRPLVKVI